MGLLEFIDKVSVQTAVYWANPVNDGTGGYTYDAPVEILCRWDDIAEKYISRTGEELISSAQILTNETLVEGSWLWLGSLTGLTTAEKANPMLVARAYPIKKVSTTPLFKSTTKFVKGVIL